MVESFAEGLNGCGHAFDCRDTRLKSITVSHVTMSSYLLLALMSSHLACNLTKWMRNDLVYPIIDLKVTIRSINPQLRIVESGKNNLWNT